MRYTVTYGRKVNPRQYETLNIELSQEFDDELTPREVAYDEVRVFVLRKIEDELAIDAEKYVEGSLMEDIAKGKEVKEAPASAEPLFYKLKGVDDIGWKASQWIRKGDFDRGAREGEDAWCYINDSNAQELVDIVKREDKAFVVIRGTRYVCTFTGEGKFISRKKYEKKEKQ